MNPTLWVKLCQGCPEALASSVLPVSNGLPTERGITEQVRAFKALKLA